MSSQNEIKSEPFNLKEFIRNALSHKYFYIITIIILVISAYFYNKFSPNIYQVSSIIGPIEESRNALLQGSEQFVGFGELGQTRNLENDINSLNSFGLVSETIKNMGLEISYFKESDNIFRHPHQLFGDNSFTVNIDKSHSQSIDTRFYVDIINDTTYRLKISDENVSLYNYLDNEIISSGHIIELDTLCHFNQIVTTPYFKFSLTRNTDSYKKGPDDEISLFFELHHIDRITRKYMSNLSVETVSLRSTLINIFFEGENRNLTVDFLNNYLQTYLENNLAKKNSIALNTINFIDAQLSEISDSLYLSESKLRDYRTSHQVTDLSYQGQQAINQLNEIENQRSTLNVQERYYNYILDYFNTNKDIAGLAPPSAANVLDPIMNTLVLELLDLNAQKSAILSNNAEKNLFLDQIDNKIDLQKRTIIENVKNNLNTLSLNMNELDYREERLSRQISALPRTELNMVSMQRQFNLTDAIYTFMLQKRSEAGISMASNYPDYEILEPARQITSAQIAPKKLINYTASLFLALLIPTLFIILKDFFNEKITKVREVELLLGKPIFGVIYNNSTKSEAVVHDAPGSAIAESFRNLRSSLFLKSKKEPIKIILVTSSQPQDGKSFIAMNLASSIAAVGYKTIVVDCDLRRPTLHEKFKVSNTAGLSKFLMDRTAVDDIILNTFVDNLHFIPSGPILPNSSELIESGALDELIQSLEDKYDYIIIDTTPSGIVADAALLMKYASFNLLVCRNNYTRKDVFESVINFFTKHGIGNFDIVYNDFELNKSEYGQYQSYYKKPHRLFLKK